MFALLFRGIPVFSLADAERNVRCARYQISKSNRFVSFTGIAHIGLGDDAYPTLLIVVTAVYRRTYKEPASFTNPLEDEKK